MYEAYLILFIVAPSIPFHRLPFFNVLSVCLFAFLISSCSSTHIYSTYIQYIHIVHTYSTYTQYIHTVLHTHSTYMGFFSSSAWLTLPYVALRYWRGKIGVGVVIFIIFIFIFISSFRNLCSGMQSDPNYMRYSAYSLQEKKKEEEKKRKSSGHRLHRSHTQTTKLCTCTCVCVLGGWGCCST